MNELGEEQLLPEEIKEVILAEIDGLPLESYTETIDGATMIRIAVESIIEGINKAHLVVVGGLNNKLHLANELELSLRQRNTELERDYQLISDEHAEIVAGKYELTLDNQQLTLERDQALLYRDNAVKQLEDMAFELEQARIEVNRSREVKAYTEAERTAQAEEARQRLINSRIKIYNVQWEDDIRQVTKVCYIAETGEPHTFNYLERGKYTEITEEEALAIQAMNAPVEMPEVESQEVFQEEDASLPDVQQGAEQENSRSEQPTIRENETFEQEVRRRLTALEESVTDIIG